MDKKKKTKKLWTCIAVSAGVILVGVSTYLLVKYSANNSSNSGEEEEVKPEPQEPLQSPRRELRGNYYNKPRYNNGYNNKKN